MCDKAGQRRSAGHRKFGPYLLVFGTVRIVVLTKLAMPHLEKSGGNVLNISSCASQRFMSARVRPFYGVMKAALDHWTRVMALNCGEKGVRINSIK
ncbi:hypothetical protein GPALN_013126 [Globodera pallida]|nr:hypothetical protein GPALN_013126 [Globodera pallida]